MYVVVVQQYPLAISASSIKCSIEVEVEVEVYSGIARGGEVGVGGLVNIEE